MSAAGQANTGALMAASHWFSAAVNSDEGVGHYGENFTSVAADYLHGLAHWLQLLTAALMALLDLPPTHNIMWLKAWCT